MARGDGGCGSVGQVERSRRAIPVREPDHVCDLETLPQAALVYRLSGDYNPLHADPEVARSVGFDRPILHGLCTFGVAGHAILKACCDYDPGRIRSTFVRFTAPVFPGETIVHDWPDEALKSHGLDQRTAVVTLTHDTKLDDPAIMIALRSKIFYLGCLGSNKTHGKRVERLKAAGFSDDEIARIHAPVGLDIGAKSPAEIAISIMAEMTERLRRPGAA